MNSPRSPPPCEDANLDTSMNSSFDWAHNYLELEWESLLTALQYHSAPYSYCLDDDGYSMYWPVRARVGRATTT